MHERQLEESKLYKNKKVGTKEKGKEKFELMYFKFKK